LNNELKKTKEAMQALKEKYVKEQNNIESKLAFLEKRLNLGTNEGKVDHQNDKVKTTSKSHQSTTTSTSNNQPTNNNAQKTLNGNQELKQRSNTKKKEISQEFIDTTKNESEENPKEKWGAITLTKILSYIPTYGLYPQYKSEDNDNEFEVSVDDNDFEE